jgi:hypothetical protein
MADASCDWLENDWLNMTCPIIPAKPDRRNRRSPARLVPLAVGSRHTGQVFATREEPVTHWKFSARERTGLLLIAALLCPIAAPASEGSDDLLTLMTRLQTLGHKLQLSLDADNRPLAAFYAHELEEAAEAVAEIESYDGHPVGALTTAMLLPPIAALRERLLQARGGEASADETSAGEAFDRLVVACNACHAATGHAFIVIARNPSNPYAQSFTPP